MIRYFVRAGDSGVDQSFDLYKKPFSNLLKKELAGKIYGSGLNMILIEYYLEGQFLVFPKKEYSVLRFNRQEQAITVVIGISKGFHFLSDSEKKRVIVETTLNGIDLVKKQMSKLGYEEIDFDNLENDVRKCAEEFLQKPI